MYHSYVMGIDESIYTLEHQGFEIKNVIRESLL